MEDPIKSYDNSMLAKDPKNLFEVFGITGHHVLTPVLAQGTLDAILANDEMLQTFSLLLQSLIPEDANTVIGLQIPYSVFYDNLKGTPNPSAKEINDQNQRRQYIENQTKTRKERLMQLRNIAENNFNDVDTIYLPVTMQNAHWILLKLSIVRQSLDSDSSCYYHAEITNSSDMLENMSKSDAAEFYKPLLEDIQQILGRVDLDNIEYTPNVLQGSPLSCGFALMLNLLCEVTNANLFDFFPTIDESDPSIIPKLGKINDDFHGYCLSANADYQWRMQVYALLMKYLERNDLQERMAYSCKLLTATVDLGNGYEILEVNADDQYYRVLELLKNKDLLNEKLIDEMPEDTEIQANPQIYAEKLRDLIQVHHCFADEEIKGVDKIISCKEYDAQQNVDHDRTILEITPQKILTVQFPQSSSFNPNASNSNNSTENALMLGQQKSSELLSEYRSAFDFHQQNGSANSALLANGSTTGPSYQVPQQVLSSQQFVPVPQGVNPWNQTRLGVFSPQSTNNNAAQQQEGMGQAQLEESDRKLALEIKRLKQQLAELQRQESQRGDTQQPFFGQQPRQLNNPK